MSENSSRKGWLVGVSVTVVLAVMVRWLWLPDERAHTDNGRSAGAVPVEVAEIRHGSISLHRTFSGSITPRAQLEVSPKVSGRIEQLLVNVADTVQRGQLVALLDDAEFEQALLEAEAQLAVEQAHYQETASRLEISQRELDRIETLFRRDIASESAFDTARAQFLTAQAAVQVAGANIKREEAALKAAKIRFGYTRVAAEWNQGDAERTVTRLFVDEGNTVAANTPLLAIVELDPVVAVIEVTEKEYPLLQVGQTATIRADAYPQREFTGVVARIFPVFQASSRQVTVEIEVDNPDSALKPGMFARCTLELERIDLATIIPQRALTKRNGRLGVFHLHEEGGQVNWVTVEPGLESDGEVVLTGSALRGRVVTLGQQFLRDGSKILVVTAEYDSNQRSLEQ